MSQDIGIKSPLRIRMGFVVELAKRLHEYGTAAPRLEDVINLVSARLGLSCNVLSTPTSIVMSFSDLTAEEDLAEITQVVRLDPGAVDLKRLCQIDEIADQVIDGRLDLAAGRRKLREFRASERSANRTLVVASHAISAAAIAVILHAGWAGVATAGPSVP
jgi:uncharacterized membrane protein YjjP (DUF1212 family)